MRRIKFALLAVSLAAYACGGGNGAGSNDSGSAHDGVNRIDDVQAGSDLSMVFDIMPGMEAGQSDAIIAADMRAVMDLHVVPDLPYRHDTAQVPDVVVQGAADLPITSDSLGLSSEDGESTGGSVLLDGGATDSVLMVDLGTEDLPSIESDVHFDSNTGGLDVVDITDVIGPFRFC